MSRYHHHFSYHHQARFIKKAKLLLAVILLTLLLIAAIVGIDALREAEEANSPSIPSQETSASFLSATEIFRTQYFQFQADKSWRQVTNETTPTHFVYRSFRGPLVERSLVISVEASARESEATRVLPITIDGYDLIPGRVSDHCSKATDSKIPITVSLLSVKFTCSPSSTAYKVVVGLAGGGSLMDLRRPDGSLGSYRINYEDVTTNPSNEPLENLMRSFQTR